MSCPNEPGTAPSLSRARWALGHSSELEVHLGGRLVELVQTGELLRTMPRGERPAARCVADVRRSQRGVLQLRGRAEPGRSPGIVWEMLPARCACR